MDSEFINHADPAPKVALNGMAGESAAPEVINALEYLWGADVDRGYASHKNILPSQMQANDKCGDDAELSAIEALSLALKNYRC